MRSSTLSTMKLATDPSRSESGSALVAFLGTALLLVTLLAIGLRFQPGRFGIPAQGGDSEAAPTGAADPLGAASRNAATDPAGPQGALDRYNPRPVAEALAFDAEERARIELYRAAQRSVCLISSLSAGPAPAIGAPRDPRGGDSGGEPRRGTGTGFIWDRAGHVVTSAHVVAGSMAATVTLADGSVHNARLVGYEQQFDLAVMRIDAPPDRIVPLPFGTSSELLVGQRVYSIGYPYELERTFSEGMVCGLGRTLLTNSGATLLNVIQTDADLHPGSSGGPLLDSSGRVVGLATAVHSAAQNGAGVAFALPVDLMQEVVPRIMRQGLEWFPRLGLVVESDGHASELLRRMRAKGVAQNAPWLEHVPESGIVVLVVEPGGSAEANGLRGMRASVTTGGNSEVGLRDIIVEVSGTAVQSRDEFDLLIEAARPAGHVDLVIAWAEGLRDVRLVFE